MKSILRANAALFSLLLVALTMAPALAEGSLELTKERTLIYFGAPW